MYDTIGRDSSYQTSLLLLTNMNKFKRGMGGVILTVLKPPQFCGCPTSGAPEFTPGLQWGSCYSIFSFMCNVLQIFVCPFSFGHCIVCCSSIYGF